MPNWVRNRITFQTKEDAEKFKKITCRKNGEISFEKLIPQPKILTELDPFQSGFAKTGFSAIQALEALWVLALRSRVKTPAELGLRYFKQGNNLLDESRFDFPSWIRAWRTTQPGPHSYANDYASLLNALLSETFHDFSKGLGQQGEFHLTEERALELGRGGLKARQLYGTDEWYNWRLNNWGCKWDASNIEWTSDFTVEFETPWCWPNEWFERVLHHGDFHDSFTLDYADEDIGSNLGSVIAYPDDNGINVSRHEDETVRERVDFAYELWGYSSEEEIWTSSENTQGYYPASDVFDSVEPSDLNPETYFDFAKKRLLRLRDVYKEE